MTNGVREALPAPTMMTEAQQAFGVELGAKVADLVNREAAASGLPGCASVAAMSLLRIVAVGVWLGLPADQRGDRSLRETMRRLADIATDNLMSERGGGRLQ
jgi:hypothetical protein